jgi:hypothetical protein
LEEYPVIVTKMKKKVKTIEDRLATIFPDMARSYRNVKEEGMYGHDRIAEYLLGVQEEFRTVYDSLRVHTRKLYTLSRKFINQ